MHNSSLTIINNVQHFNIQVHISLSRGNKEIVLFRSPIGIVLGEGTACAVVQAPRQTLKVERMGAGQPMGLWVPAGPGSTEVRQMQQVGRPYCSEVPQDEFQALHLPQHCRRSRAARLGTGFLGLCPPSHTRKWNEATWRILVNFILCADTLLARFFVRSEKLPDAA